MGWAVGEEEGGDKDTRMPLTHCKTSGGSFTRSHGFSI